MTPPAQPTRLARIIADASKQCSVGETEIEDLYPCTPLQQGLLALSSNFIGAYTAHHVFEIQSNVDVDRLKSAWQSVSDRHAILRSRVINLQSKGFQTVLRAKPLVWNDCTDLEAYLKQAKSASKVHYGAPLSSVAISETHLVWVVHHALYDASTVRMVLDDVAANYDGLPLPLRRPFGNFVKYIQRVNDPTASRSFWTSRLASDSVTPFPKPSLPDYAPRPNQIVRHTAQDLVTKPSAITGATIIKAALALTLSSQPSSPTALFGVTVSGRDTPVEGIENMMGPTIATMPMSLNIESEETVQDFLQRVQQDGIDVIPHQHIGLQNIKGYGEKVALACDFQTLLSIVANLNDEEQAPSYAHLLRPKQDVVEEDFFNYPLVIQCILTGKGELKVQATHDKYVISTTATRRLLSQLEHIVRQLLSAEDDIQVSSLQLITPEDLQQISDWNAQNKMPQPPGIPWEEVRKHIAAEPNAPAIAAWDGDLTYTDLDTRSRNLAHHLTSQRGIGEHDTVPICVERSSWLAVAVVAVMRSSAAFTILDPEFPAERLLNTVRRLDSAIVIVSAAHEHLFSKHDIGTLIVDQKSQGISDVPEAGAKLADVSPEDMLYVVFTSGSTGEPKGAMITHGSYYAGAKAHIPLYGIDRQSRMLSFGSYSFDLCILDILSTLMGGGCLCIPSSEERLSNIAGFMREKHVTCATLTPSFARRIGPEEVPSLKVLAFGGEALTWDQQNTWADKVRLLNCYGPAECSVESAINTRVTSTSNPANIGRLITGSSWIVHPNDHDKLVPIGAVGELLIEGPLVGLGYLNDPIKTADSFITNPAWASLSNSAPRRFYKTGDLVRYDSSDGSLLFEGRKDTQIKIHGLRVEVGEIEHHLKTVFAYADNTTVVLYEQEGPAQLIAVVACGSLVDTQLDQSQMLSTVTALKSSSLSEIRSSLSKVLPRHMIPTRFLLVPSLPSLPSTKLDRKTLQNDIDNGRLLRYEVRKDVAEVSLLDLADPTATKLGDKIVRMVSRGNQASMAEIEGRDLTISSLAMDSIQIIDLMSFIRNDFGVQISISTLYEDDMSIAKIAAIISNDQADTKEVEPSLNLSGEVLRLSESLTSKSSLVPASSQITEKFTSPIVFLTGATGYLGTELLHQLLCIPSIQKVIVLVRAPDILTALARIVKAATLAKWWSPVHTTRIEPWVGNLGTQNLGLSDTQWQVLTGDCDFSDRVSHIIHNGATVQWQAPYSALKASNVDSTFALLEALSHWNFDGSFTYVSGGIEAALNGTNTAMSENDAEADFERRAEHMKVENGYGQTKFVSEELVARFARSHAQHEAPSTCKSASQGQIFHIVRPGLIIGTPEHGVPNTDDFLWRLVQACVSLRAYPSPSSSDFWLTVTDTAAVAQRVLAGAQEINLDHKLEPQQRQQASLMVDNINDGLATHEFWAIVREEVDITLEPMSPRAWVQHVFQTLHQASESEKHPWQPILAMLEGDTYELGHPAEIRGEAGDRVHKAVRSNVRYLVQMGFLDGRVGNEGIMAEGEANESIATAFGRSKLRAGR